MVDATCSLCGARILCDDCARSISHDPEEPSVVFAVATRVTPRGKAEYDCVRYDHGKETGRRRFESHTGAKRYAFRMCLEMKRKGYLATGIDKDGMFLSSDMAPLPSNFKQVTP